MYGKSGLHDKNHWEIICLISLHVFIYMGGFKCFYKPMGHHFSQHTTFIYTFIIIYNYLGGNLGDWQLEYMHT